MSFEEIMKKAKKEGTAENITPEFVLWEEAGQVITGRLLSVHEVPSQIGNQVYNQYVFETDTGLLKFHLGRATDAEVAGTMKEGGVYSIVFDGKESISGGRTVNKFTVYDLTKAAQSQETIQPENV